MTNPFQYPEGHSSGFHRWTLHGQWPPPQAVFQYPEGHSSGFHVITLIAILVVILVSLAPAAFQYPEGHSSGFHWDPELEVDEAFRISVPRRAFLWFPLGFYFIVGGHAGGRHFSTPKGIPLVSTLYVKGTPGDGQIISVPRRAFLWFPQ